MNCRHCRAAETNPNHPLQTRECRGCGIRELANSPLYHASGVAGRLEDDYSKALARVFGQDIRAGHLEVKAEKARLDALRAPRVEA